MNEKRALRLAFFKLAFLYVYFVSDISEPIIGLI